MKKQSLAIFSLVILFSLLMCSFVVSFDCMKINETDTIDLYGDLIQDKGIRSATVKTSPITAEKQGSVVFAMFHVELGDIQITITDDMGNEVFMQTVNTITYPQVTIPLFGLPSGVYTIAFRNDRGEMYGDFEI